MKVSDRQNQQPSTLRTVAGVATGAVIGLYPITKTIKNMFTPLTDESIKKQKIVINKLFKELDSFDKIKQNADDIIAETILRDKKIKINVVNSETLKQQKPLPEARTLMKSICKKLKTRNDKMFANGLNACFMPRKREIKISNTGLYSAVFHEIGHALNCYANPATKILQKVRVLTFITAPIPAIGILAVGLSHTNKRKNEEQKASKAQKIASFIHKNAGKLTFLWFTPTLAEEALASLRGLKVAKKYLTPLQHKRHIKNQIFAFSTYFVTFFALATANTLGIFVKDKIVNKKSN